MRDQQLRLNLDLTALIAELEKYYSHRRELPPNTALIEALFCLNSYVFDVSDTTPYLLYDSATGGCGKSTALEFHEAVCVRAYLAVDPSPAVVFRLIDRDQPTFFLDEARVLSGTGDRAQEMLVIFDAGYKKGAVVPRCEDHGETLRNFKVYCPKAAAMVGVFRGTLLDRGIVIHLTKSQELPQTFLRVLRKEAAPIRKQLEAYATQYRSALEGLYENQPDDRCLLSGEMLGCPICPSALTSLRGFEPSLSAM